MTAFDSHQIVDRFHIRTLVDSYARYADRREPAAHAALFTETGRLAIYEGEPGGEPPRSELIGRPALAKAFAKLDRFDVTSHFIGQHTVELDGDRATGETYCLAHHVDTNAVGEKSLTVMSIRYLDRFVRSDEGWLIDERVLAVDYTEVRPLQPRR